MHSRPAFSFLKTLGFLKAGAPSCLTGVIGLDVMTVFVRPVSRCIMPDTPFGQIWLRIDSIWLYPDIPAPLPVSIPLPIPLPLYSYSCHTPLPLSLNLELPFPIIFLFLFLFLSPFLFPFRYHDIASET